MKTSSTHKRIHKSFVTKLLLSLGFASIGPLLIAGLTVTTSSYGSPKICEGLSPETLTVTATSRQYRQCKAALKQILKEANFEKEDRRFNTIASQLEPNEQLTYRTITAFEAVFLSVQESYAKQLPRHIQVRTLMLILLLSCWLTACFFLVPSLFA